VGNSQSSLSTLGSAVHFWQRFPRDPAHARRLYAALRELDAAGCEVIRIEAPPETAT
jgi:hypothetical protein